VTSTHGDLVNPRHTSTLPRQEPKGDCADLKITENYFVGVYPGLLRRILKDGITGYWPAITPQASARC